MSEQTDKPSVPPSAAQIPPQQMQLAMETLRSEQNFLFGTMAGLAAALVGAALWAVLTALSEYQSGFMAIGVGLLVGFAIRLAGKGLDMIFGITGAVLSLLGCLLGNLLAVVYFVAADEGVPFMEALERLDPSTAIALLAATFEYTDIFFYAIAVYFGYSQAFRQISEEDLNRALGKIA